MAGQKFGKARASGIPSEAVERKMRILLELVRNKFVTVSRLCEEYETSERSLLRDFQELRRIGERAGFTLSERIENDQIRLTAFDARPTALGKGDRALRTLIQDAAHAFGEPVEQQLQTLVDAGAAVNGQRRFLKFLLPKLREGSRIAEVYNALEGAWRNNARVTFSYSGKARLVEPAVVLVRSGRYYLVGRDPKAREWKYYALDKVTGTIARAGSFSPQPVPERYLSDDVIGFLQGGGEHRVGVWLSANIAPSATSREWQAHQEIAYADDGSATITFAVSDIDEVVRWALGFGAEARVVSPDESVAHARAIAAEIARSYGAT